MDADTNDSVSGIGDALNGDAKHDSSTLIQAAIINKDVMLSGVSQQASPLSSSLALPSLSVPATMGSSSSGVAALGDNFFLGIQPLGMTDLAELHRNDQTSGSVFSPTLSSASHQLLGQPQVTPQFLIANQAGLASPSTMPIQHLLIPVSTGNGTQQLVSIPLSLAAGFGNQMQLLATSSGQLIATNMAGLAPQLNLTIPTSTNVAQNIQNLALRQLVQQQQSGSTTASVAPSTNIPQIITNAQGQIVAIGSPQLLQQNIVTNSTSGSAVASAAGSTKIGQLVQQLQRSAAAVAAAASADTASAGSASSTGGGGVQTLTLAATPIATAGGSSGAPQKTTLQINLAQMTQALLSAGTAVVQATGGEAVSTTGGGVGAGATGGTTSAGTGGGGGGGSGGGGGINGVTPNINQLLPNTISSTREGTIVDGVNLDEMREFAKQFKIRRLSLGLTQTQVGQALSVTEGPSYSQSAICRFEKLDITPKSAQKIKPVLERWMAMAEERYKNGMQNLTEFIGLEPSKKRKRRTSFTPQALELLNEHFERSTHPSGAEMSKLASDLNYDREIIRIWFCNKRQVLKNTIRQLTPRN